MFLEDDHAYELATDLIVKFNNAHENYEALKDILKHEEPDTERYELIREEYLKAAEHAKIRHAHAMIISCDIIQSIQEYRWN
jgi:succinate dehydrogenase/fumarate reductase-like Fe-S protein